MRDAKLGTIGGGTSTGHEALRATWTHLISFFDIVVQMPQHALIDITGDRGTGRCAARWLDVR